MRSAQIKLLLFFFIATGLSVANDGAASTAAGGIQLVREPRIAMRTEKLTISREKITVEYDFANDTDRVAGQVDRACTDGQRLDRGVLDRLHPNDREHLEDADFQFSVDCGTSR